MERGRAQCATLLGIADEAFARTPWLSSDEFGFGGIPLGCIAYARFNMPVEHPDHPALDPWYGRLEQRPAYRKGVTTALT